MRIHILGISGTFMGGIALLASEAGHEVRGSDQAVYPPMSTQLAAQGIQWQEGYDPSHIGNDIDCVIVGNVIRRGNPLMESVMTRGLPYVSGPEWLASHILKNRQVLAVSGTHGKTTTTAMLVHLLEAGGYSPGFLVGGIPVQQGISAHAGKAPFFVIEADEYDSAFFDKRSKFIHYRPRTLILNNIEFDHADIFPDLAAVQQQFHYLVRTVPGNGHIIRPSHDTNIDEVLARGCWTPVIHFGGTDGQWRAELLKPDGSQFSVWHQGSVCGEVSWKLLGQHNVQNALAALAAAHEAGLPAKQAVNFLSDFQGVRRRMEVRGQVNGVTVYDDFAHHPTAIATTLAGLRAREGQASRIIVVLDPGSYTMRTGVHRDTLPAALCDADWVVCRDPGAGWDVADAFKSCPRPVWIASEVDALAAKAADYARPGDHVVVMSNTGFGGIHEKLLAALG